MMEKTADSQKPRRGTARRETKETRVQAVLTLDGSGKTVIETGVGFLDHMLEQLARHGLFDIDLKASGDLHVDFHHTVEDVGITLGRAFRSALGDRRGVTRFGSALIPLDEALSRVVVDLSNRPTLIWRVVFPSQKIGVCDVELFREWFAAFAASSGITLHVENLYGDNSHHIIESCFKGLARALREACTQDVRRCHEIPSTKGTLSS